MNTLSPVCFMGRLLLLLFPMKICLNILEKWHPTTLSCYLWVIGIHKSISLWSFMRVYSIMRSVMMATFQVEFLIVIDYLKAFIFQNTSEVLKAIKWNWKLFRFDQFITLQNILTVLKAGFTILFHKGKWLARLLLDGFCSEITIPIFSQINSFWAFDLNQNKTPLRTLGCDHVTSSRVRSSKLLAQKCGPSPVITWPKIFNFIENFQTSDPGKVV